MKITRAIDADKEIYLADYNGEQLIVTPSGAPIDCDEVIPPENVKNWVVLDENWEEIGLIEEKQNGI